MISKGKGITTNSFNKKNLPPIEMKPDNKKRLQMSKAEVVAESIAAANKRAKIEEFKRKLEEGETDGLRNEENQKGQEVVQKVTGSADAGNITPGAINPLVKRRGRPKAEA